jgi:hypothetical protein
MVDLNTEALNHEVECPGCDARFLFRRASVPHVDAHGFETYWLACGSCGASLAGVVDPLNNALVLN